MTTKIKPSEGDPTNMAYTDKVNEELSDDQRDALEELERILDKASELGSEARDIVAQSFPNHLSQGDAYGAFNFGDSSNSYDTTLSSIVQNIYDGDEDMDEGVAKTKKAHDLVVNKMKELAKKYRAGDKSVIDQLKDLTAKKKSLEAMLDKDVADTGRDQELDEAELDKKEKKKLKDMSKSLKKSSKGHAGQAKYLDKLTKENA